MREPRIIEELGDDQFVAHKLTPEQRIEHAELEYEQRMEKLKDEDLRQVELAARGMMSERKRNMLLNILDELQERIQKTDEEFEKTVPGGAANSLERKELIGILDLLRHRLLKKRVELTIAHAQEHAPAIAHAALASFKK